MSRAKTDRQVKLEQLVAAYERIQPDPAEQAVIRAAIAWEKARTDENARGAGNELISAVRALNRRKAVPK